MTDDANLPMIKVEGADKAPVISFDEAPVFGVIPGIGRVTLTALILDQDPDGSVRQRAIAVAHLRGNALAFAGLRAAIDAMELMITGPAKPEGPTN